MKKLVYSGLTNEAVLIDLTDEEINQLKKDAQDYSDGKKSIELEAEAKAEAKIALLNRLGITAEEAKLLFS